MSSIDTLSFVDYWNRGAIWNIQGNKRNTLGDIQDALRSAYKNINFPDFS
jgi:hypothetical protein